MQLVSSRIWTRVTVTISYNDNHYTTGTSFFAQPLRSGRIWHKVNFLCLLLSSMYQSIYLSQFVSTSISVNIYLSLTRLDTRSKARRPIKVGIKGRVKVGNEPRLEPCWSMLLIGSLGAMWVWWGKQLHEPKCGSGHICRVMVWTRQQCLVPYISFEKVREDHCLSFLVHYLSIEVERQWCSN